MFFSFRDNSVSFLHILSRSKVTFWLRCPTSFGHLSGNPNRTLHIVNLFFGSSFYGLLDILSGTDLNNGQREIGLHLQASPFLSTESSTVQTAKQSCELLLKVHAITDLHAYTLTRVPWRSSTQSSITVNSRPQVIAFHICPWKNESQYHNLALKLEYTGFSVEDIIAVRFHLTQRAMRHTGI
jgi:hypothetical protein